MSLSLVGSTSATPKMVCSWCYRTILEGDPDQPVTHGICGCCDATLLAHLDGKRVPPVPEVPDTEVAVHLVLRLAQSQALDAADAIERAVGVSPEVRSHEMARAQLFLRQAMDGLARVARVEFGH